MYFKKTLDDYGVQDWNPASRGRIFESHKYNRKKIVIEMRSSVSFLFPQSILDLAACSFSDTFVPRRSTFFDSSECRQRDLATSC